MTLKEKARAKRLWDNYKLTPDMYESIAKYQDYKCYACGRHESVPGRHLSVDHDWVTGLIRGLLCSRCNPIIGKIERALVRFGLAKIGIHIARWAGMVSTYMQNPPATAALGHPHFGYKGQVGTKAHRKRIQQDRKSVPPLKPLVP